MRSKTDRPPQYAPTAFIMEPKMTLFRRPAWAGWKVLLCATIALFSTTRVTQAPKPTYHALFLIPAEKITLRLPPAPQDFGAEFLQKHLPKASQVSAEGGFSLPVIQQPPDNPVYVSNKPDLITQFSTPAENGVTGLLAHNYRSGKEFYKLTIGQRVTVRYDKGVTRHYRVVSINRFQKLDRSSIFSDLIDLTTAKRMTSTELFNRFYRGPHHVTFQTCLEGDGHPDWGLYFVVAEPDILP